MGATNGTRTANPFGAPEFTRGFSGVRVIFSVVFWRSLFVLLFFVFWGLCCLSSDLRIVVTPLVCTLLPYLLTTVYC